MKRIHAVHLATSLAVALALSTACQDRERETETNEITSMPQRDQAASPGQDPDTRPVAGQRQGQIESGDQDSYTMNREYAGDPDPYPPEQQGQMGQQGQQQGQQGQMGQMGQQGQPQGQMGQQGQQQLDQRAQKVLKEVHASNHAEIQMGQAAMKRQNLSPEARKLATMLIEDHRSADQDLMKMAPQLGMKLQATPKIPADLQRKVTKIEKMEAANFDTEFARQQAQIHQKEIDKLSQAMQEIDNPQVTQYLSKVIPVLEKHLMQATNMQRQAMR